MNRIYLFPILYVISIYIIPILGWLGITLPTFVGIIPLVFGIINYLVAFLINKEYNDNIFTSAVIIKYSLIPFFIVGGVITCCTFLLGIIPHFSFLMIGGVAFIFIGYLLIVLGSAYQVAYIRTLVKEKNINVIFAVVLVILSFVFYCDVISIMILSLLKDKHRKLTIFVIVLLFIIFVLAVLSLIYFVMVNHR